MPLAQNLAFDWPARLHHLREDALVALGRADKSFCRIDADVDPETLLFLNEFEAHARQRKVRLRRTGNDDCLVGEMNPLIGLGAASDPTRHVGKVRISFHDLQNDNCEDEAA